MRPWVVLAIAAVVLLVPGVDAGRPSWQLASDAPVALDGRVSLSGPDAVAYHHAHHDGTLTGQAAMARLYKHTARHLLDPTRYDCGYGGASEPQTVLTADTESVRIRYQLAAGSLARIEFPKGLELPRPTPTPTVYFGPNPYLAENQQDPAVTAPAPRFANAFPAASFVLVPDTLAFAGRYVLTLEMGAIHVWVNNADAHQAFATKVFIEKRRPAPGGLVPPLENPSDCEYEVVEWYVLDAQTSTLLAAQEGGERTQRYWNGEPLGKAFPTANANPPQGMWDRTQSASFGEALKALLLPQTVIDLAGGVVRVDGDAVFERALGSAALGGRLHEVAYQTATVRGDLVLTAVETDETLRMTTKIEGELLGFLVAGERDEGWREYVPGLVLAGSVGAVGAAAWGWPLVKLSALKWALFPLYARLRKEDILENPLRDDILEAVEASPGISASDLGRRLSCGWGTLVYHLTVLERMQLISSAREGRHRRFFVQGRINYSDKDAVALLANPHARNILDAIRGHPGLIQRDLSRTLGLSAGTVAWHVERMAQAGLVLKEEEGRVVRYYPSQKLLELTRQLAA